MNNRSDNIEKDLSEQPNFKDEIGNPVSVKDIFDELFQKKSPWASRIYSPEEEVDVNKIIKKSKENNITQ